MLNWIREKFGTVVIGSIISLIAIVFIFYGVFSPKATRGLQEGAVAGTVNGEAISISEYNQELNRRMEFFKNMSGGKFSDEQLKSLRIREGVFNELADRKILIQEARRLGLVASDEEVKDQIQAVPAFQKDGKFDIATYKQLLEANNFTPGGYEKLNRDELSARSWEAYFRNRVQATEQEIKREFALSHEKRNLKYVLLSTDSARDKVRVEDAEVQKFLADPGNTNLVKVRFEEGKETKYKGSKLEDVQAKIAREVLASGKMDEVNQINEKLAQQVIALVGSTQDVKKTDSKVNDLLKPYHVEVKSSGMVARRSLYLPGVGDSQEVLNDAFQAKSPLDLKQGGTAKKYSLPGRVLVAWVVDSEKADFAQMDKEREGMIRQILARKTRDLFQDWIEKAREKAKIDINPSVVNAE